MPYTSIDTSVNHTDRTLPVLVPTSSQVSRCTFKTMWAFGALGGVF